MTTLPHLVHPETLPPDPTPPARSANEVRCARPDDERDVVSLARAREVLSVIKSLVERLEEHLDEVG
jgi:hypothetical protein